MREAANQQQIRLTFLQHNVNKSREAHHSIFDIALRKRADFLCLQEPYNYQIQGGPWRTLTHPSFYLLSPFEGHLDQKIRVVTYVRVSAQIEFTPRYDILQDPDCQLFEVLNRDKPFLCLNVYNERQHLQDGTRGHFTLERAVYPLYFLLFLCFSLEISIFTILDGTALPVPQKGETLFASGLENPFC